MRTIAFPCDPVDLFDALMRRRLPVDLAHGRFEVEVPAREVRSG